MQDQQTANLQRAVQTLQHDLARDEASSREQLQLLTNEILEADYARLQRVRADMGRLTNQRKADIRRALQDLRDIEKERGVQLQRLLHHHVKLISSIAHLLPADIEAWAFEHALRINQELLSNQHDLADLEARFLAHEVRREFALQHNWQLLEADWRAQHQGRIADQLSLECTNPKPLSEGVPACIDRLRQEQTGIYHNLLNVLNRLNSLSASDASLALREAQDALVECHKTATDDLERVLDQLDDECFARLQAAQTHMVEQHYAVDMDEAVQVLEGACMPLILEQQGRVRDWASDVQQRLIRTQGAITTQTHSLLKILERLEGLQRHTDIDFRQAQEDILTNLRQQADQLEHARGPLEDTLNDHIDLVRQAGSNEELLRAHSTVTILLDKIETLIMDAGVKSAKTPAQIELPVKQILQAYRNEVTATLKLSPLPPGVPPAAFSNAVVIDVGDERFELLSRRWDIAADLRKEVDAIPDAQGPSARPVEVTPFWINLNASVDGVCHQLLLPEDAIEEIWRQVCQMWVERVQDRFKSINHRTEQYISEKTRELEIENKMHVAVHAARRERIAQDVRNLRSAELTLHQQHVVAHTQNLESDLDKERDRFLQQQADLSDQAEQFVAYTRAAIDNLAQQGSTGRLVLLHGDTRQAHEDYVRSVRTALITYRKSIDDRVRLFRERNAHFRASFRTFTEKGNFSAAEISQYKLVIDQLFSKIDALEGVVLEDLDVLEGRYLEAAQVAIDEFYSLYNVHSRDVKLLDDTKRIMNSYKVRVQSEINHSNARHQKLLEEAEALRELSLEDPPSARLLFEKTRIVSSLILERSKYLDCILPGAPHTSIGDHRPSTATKNTAGQNSGRVSTGRHSAMPPRSSSRSAAKAGKLPPRGPLNNTLPVALRGMRLMVEEWPSYPTGTFLFHITQLRTACREDVLQAATPYYERGHAKHTLRPNQIKETIQSFMDNIQMDLNMVNKRAAEFRIASAQELINAVESATAVMSSGAAAIFEGITVANLDNHRRLLQNTTAELEQTLADLSQRYQQVVVLLKPALSHPNRRAELEQLIAEENDIIERWTALSASFRQALTEQVDTSGAAYVHEMNSMVSGMVEVLELALIREELYVPGMPPDSTTPPQLDESQRAMARDKGRFPLLVLGMVVPRSGRRAASGHGVGMLITWLHKKAMAARNDNTEKAKQYFQHVLAARDERVKQLEQTKDEQHATFAKLLDAVQQL
ncbi:uncharacterized protein MONBRDRAFT_32610 [Monosiga brevicollis MX1]|uniref:Uncharacterized protein n=1 Tax=Monosiga brevicollis TaxID=81824 RepID=A9V0P6_MONBE|nr:uncharacterized protein MONBRDRAFT_32610 [Monosiga brevicollis MX1]EDQ88789.1 predicted protein [Monosiga brevicollis MX1]|eukprot:XP_001746402.1 hypothetical protein [Monosiga brevicollis MX1]